MAEQRTLDAERADFEAWHAQKYPCDPLTGPSAALRWSGFRAARRSPVADAVGELAELPEPDHSLDGGSLPFYTAEQVRQAQRDAVAADRRARRPDGLSVALAEVTDRLGREAAENLSLKMEVRALSAKLARQSAPEGAPVGMAELRAAAEEAAAVFESAAKHNASKGRTVFAHEQQQRASRLRAALAAPTSASAQPADQNKMEKNDE